MQSEQHISKGNASEKKRVDWIDCAKGLGIILVIIGHTATIDGQLDHIVTRGSIFSFHMPLFFVLSCITYKMSENREQLVIRTEKAFRHLIVPMLLTFSIVVFFDLMRGHLGLSLHEYAVIILNKLIFSSGAVVDVFGVKAPALGMLWFVVALFISRQLFDYLHFRINNQKLFFLVAMAVGVCGVYVSTFQWMPLSFDVVMAVFPFLWMGMKLKTIDLDKRMLLWGFACIVIWAITLLMTYKISHTYMELAIRNYPLFPLCYLTAAAGTMSVIFAGKLITKCIGNHGLGLTWLGRNSMNLYLIHALDYNIVGLWRIDGNDAISAILRVSMDIVICILFANIQRCVLKRK